MEVFDRIYRIIRIYKPVRKNRRSRCFSDSSVEESEKHLASSCQKSFATWRGTILGLCVLGELCVIIFIYPFQLSDTTSSKFSIKRAKAIGLFED